MTASKLTPFIGLDSSGKMRIYLSAFRLSSPSAMHERGKPFPDITHRDIKEDECLDALQKLTSYYNEDERKDRRAKK